MEKQTANGRNRDEVIIELKRHNKSGIYNNELVSCSNLPAEREMYWPASDVKQQQSGNRLDADIVFILDR